MSSPEQEDYSEEEYSHDWPESSPDVPTSKKKSREAQDNQVSPILDDASPVPISNLNLTDESPDPSSIKMRPFAESAQSSPDLFQPIRNRATTGVGIDLDAKDENEYLKQQLTHMNRQIEAFQEEGAELVEFNKELQWTLMMMKKESDHQKDNVEFLRNGGTQEEWEEKQLKKQFDPESSPDKFRSPAPDNVFDQHSEFQSASAAVKSFTDSVDPSIQLRASKPESKLDIVPPHEDSPASAGAAQSQHVATPAKVLPQVEEIKEVISKTAEKHPKEFEALQTQIKEEKKEKLESSARSMKSAKFGSPAESGFDKTPPRKNIPEQKAKLKESIINLSSPQKNRKPFEVTDEPDIAIVRERNQDLRKTAQKSAQNPGSYSLDLTATPQRGSAPIHGSKPARIGPVGIQDGPNPSSYLNHVSNILEDKATKAFQQKFQLDQADAIKSIVHAYSRQSKQEHNATTQHIYTLKHMAYDPMGQANKTHRRQDSQITKWKGQFSKLGIAATDYGKN